MPTPHMRCYHTLYFMMWFIAVLAVPKPHAWRKSALFSLTWHYGPTFPSILQLSEQSVQFRLGGRLAVSAEKKVHKCEVSVEVETAPDVGSSSQAAHNCTMWINTYYGAFQHPCTVAGKTVSCRAGKMYTSMRCILCKIGC